MLATDEFVILVDEQDQEIGLMEKHEAHEKGLLHRAFSVFIFNGKGEMMLQRRALAKYHSGGLWTNTCCSHPRQGERVEDAAHRRLNEEMGFQTSLEYQYAFIYKTGLDQGMIEHEYDHVFFGEYEGEPNLNPHEAMEYDFVSLEDLKLDIKNKPDRYTVWFKMIMAKVFK